MSVYVGIDVHRKRSQVAVVTGDGTAGLNKNVVNGSEPVLQLIGDLPAGTPVASGPHSTGAGSSSYPRTTGSTRTWCTRCGARRSPLHG